MTIHDVFELRRQGRIEEAYESIRQLYAREKGPNTSLAMFWTAVDILRKRVGESRTGEAQKILLALKRLLPHVPDKEGHAHNAFKRCQDLLHNDGNQDDRGNSHLLLGEWGEVVAVDYLREEGYVILERDWRSGHRDIDIVALQGETVVFVEVKTRQKEDFGSPVLAVDYRKQRNLQLAINHYIKSHVIDNPVRFDVVTIIGSLGCSKPEISHIVDFQLSAPFVTRS